MKKPKILVISGPSGVGKDTLIEYIFKTYPGVFTPLISATTRERKADEINGTDYHFLSVEEFEAWKESGRFIETEEVYTGKLYGSPKITDEVLASGKISISDIDIMGAMNIKKFYKFDACIIFLSPPEPVEETLKERLLGRNRDTKEEIEKRIQKARYEMELAFEGSTNGLIDYIIISDSQMKFHSEIRDIIDDFLK